MEGEVDHSNETIKVGLKKGSGISGEITLPEDLEGEFVFNEKRVPLPYGTSLH